MNKKNLLSSIYVTIIIFTTGYAIVIFSNNPITAIIATMIGIILILMLLRQLFN